MGLPLDQSCNLEGLLNTVVSRGKDLQRELEESHKLEARLRQQLKEAREKEPTYPIVSEPPKPEQQMFIEQANRGSPATAEPTTPNSRLSQPVLRTPDDGMRSDFFLDDVPNSGGCGLDPRVNGMPSFRARIPGSPCSIDNADLGPSQFPGYRRSNSSEDVAAMGCGASFLEETSHLFGGGQYREERQEALHRTLARSAEDSAIQRTNSVIESSATMPPSLASQQPSSSFDLDFRTGLSGHGALTTTKRRAKPRHNMRLMSEHRGIARIRPMRSPPSPTPPSPSWTDMIPLSWQQSSGY